MKTRTACYHSGVLLCAFSILLLTHHRLAARPAPPVTVSPIVEVDSGQSQGLLVGAASYGKWLEPGKAGHNLHAGQVYHFYSPTRPIGAFSARKPEPDDHDPTQFWVPVPGLGKPSSDLVGIAGAWNALPRKVTLLSTNSALYKKVVADFLREKGISSPDVHITKILKVDLDGDGQDEVIISANRPGSETQPEARKGDYTLVLLRKIVGGNVKNILVSGQFFLHNGGQMSGANDVRIVGAFDLRGDGKMEIVSKYTAYEANGVEVYVIDKSGAHVAVGAGVGV